MGKLKKSSKLKSKLTTSKKTTRVTVDFPIKKHQRLKALAAIEGVSLQDFIRSCVDAKTESRLEERHLDDHEFKKLLKKISEEDEDILRRLADQ
jgi:predicted DNA binding CopG/RHH family protein